MAYSGEPSSTISFITPSCLSKGSIECDMYSNFSGSETGDSPDIISLNKLSNNLEQLLMGSSCDYSDADIEVEGIYVGVHRCILASRSAFFYEYFKKEKGCTEKQGKPEYSMIHLLSYGNVGYEAFLVFLGYLYTGKLKPSPPEVSTCVDNACAHDACRPAINFAVELMYVSSNFEVPELLSVCKRRLLKFVDTAFIEDIIPMLVAAYHCKSTHLLTQCIKRVARSDLENFALEKEIPYQVAAEIMLIRQKCHMYSENHVVVDPLREKRIKRIHKALDSDDVELVKLLLSESDITLNDSCALHYAAAYCDPKVVFELLGLDQADVNLHNARGYSVLHIAAMRKEPSIIISLLEKGAHASETTIDGRSTVNICRRLTRLKDYHEETKHGQKENKDRICIDVLEQETCRDPMAEKTSNCSLLIADNLHTKLLDLENRVALARILFPTQAKLAMEIAHADTTLEFSGLMTSNNSSDNLNEVVLKEKPRRLLLRIEALSKTVELGMRFFPHCAQVLDNFMDDRRPS